MSLFEHTTQMIELYCRQSADRAATDNFLTEAFGLLRHWADSTPQEAQQNTIDLYNQQTHIYPYVSLWLFQNQTRYGWTNCWPNALFPSALTFHLSNIHLPVVLQRMEQAVAENDLSFFAPLKSKRLTQLMRRLSLTVGSERLNPVLETVRAANRGLYHKILEGLPQTYLEANTQLPGAKQQLNSLILQKSLVSLVTLSPQSVAGFFQIFEDHPVEKLGEDLCGKVSQLWARTGHILSVSQHLEIAAFFQNMYPQELETLLPKFDLFTSMSPDELEWRVAVAAQYSPQNVRAMAAKLAEESLSEIGEDGEHFRQRLLQRFIQSPGALKVLETGPTEVSVWLLLYTTWTAARREHLKSAMYSQSVNPVLREISNLLIEFFGGTEAPSPTWTRVSLEGGEPTEQMTAFYEFVQRKILHQETLEAGVTRGARKM